VGEEARTVAVEPTRGHLLVGMRKETTVFDASGTKIRGDEEGGLSGLVNQAKEAANQMTSVPSASQMSANELDYVILSDPGLALAFDYSATNDIIRAIDLGTGQEQWTQTDYRWSLEKYQATGQEVATEIAEEAGLASGVAASEVNSELTRSRYVENLVTPVPEANAILLKTVSQLHRIDLETGEADWSISDVLGSRLLGTERLPSGDLILAVGNASLLDAVTGSEQVLRLDPESGEVAWRNDHGARALRDLQVRDGYLSLTNTEGQLEAYRLDDGTQTLEADPGWQMGQLSTLALSGEYKGTRYSVPLTTSPVPQNGQVYAPAVVDRQTVGDPDLGIQKYALTSGGQAWTSGPVETMRDVRDLTFVDDHVVGRVTRGRPGALTGDSYQRVVAWSPSDGSIAWNRKMPHTPSDVHAIRVKAFGQSRLPALNLVADDSQVYTVNDTSVVAIDVASGEVTQHAPLSVEGAST
jgi:outer membrane protein assembly factor BamB